MAESSPVVPNADGFLPAAMRVAESRGRRHREEEHPFRNLFQRDRDRVIHAAAFRRLEYKTQVFVDGEGDNYRTRLTHTLEVTQIARTIARALHLNEDLAEAVALSHDLGHTPFGHAGERKLNELLADVGGFNHNAQGLRVVDALEKRYAAFDGLNLTYEVREAFVRHGGPTVAAKHPEFFRDAMPLLEVAATLAADDIAYLAHDIDDGLYSKMISGGDLEALALWQRATDCPGFADFSPSLKRAEGVRRTINLLVNDLIETTRRNLVKLELTTPEKVVAAAETPVQFSPETEKNKNDLKVFLFDNFYRHAKVMTVMEEAQERLGRIYSVYTADPEKMPREYQLIARSDGVRQAAADYVAGMTDRFANDEYDRMFGKK